MWLWDVNDGLGVLGFVIIMVLVSGLRVFEFVDYLMRKFVLILLLVLLFGIRKFIELRGFRWIGVFRRFCSSLLFLL